MFSICEIPKREFYYCTNSWTNRLSFYTTLKLKLLNTFVYWKCISIKIKFKNQVQSIKLKFYFIVYICFKGFRNLRQKSVAIKNIYIFLGLSCGLLEKINKNNKICSKSQQSMTLFQRKLLEGLVVKWQIIAIDKEIIDINYWYSYQHYRYRL